MTRTLFNHKITPVETVKAMIKTATLLLVLVLVATSFLVFVSPAKAASRNIIVPDDYPTIAAAVGNASDGDTVLVRKGTYDGPFNDTLRITKSISLIGEDASSTKLTLHPAWVTEWLFASELSYYAEAMNISAPNVKLAGFTILNDGWGDIVVKSDKAQVMSNIITSHVIMDGTYQTFAYNKISCVLYPNGTAKSYAAVDFHGTLCSISSNNVIYGSINSYGFNNCFFDNNLVQGSMGTSSMGTSNLFYGNTLRDGGGISACSNGNIITNNTITNGNMGVNIGWGSNNIVYGNLITNCQGPALSETDNSGGNVFQANYVANNVVGAKIVGYLSTTRNTTLYHNNFINNIKQVNTDQTEYVLSYSGPNFTRTLKQGGYFDNGAQGNYWSDYTGTDANGDGIGDTPYMIDTRRSDHCPLTAPFDISSLTIQLPTWANLTIPTQFPTPSFPPQTQPTSTPANPVNSASPTPTPTPSPTPNASSVQQPTSQQDSQQSQPTEIQEPQPLPSPLIIAALIIASVAVFGIILSLCLRKRNRKQTYGKKAAL